MSKILEKIDMDKEVLSTMPKNNKKNISKYIQYVQELKQDYGTMADEIYEEMSKRYKKITSVKTNKEIKEEETEISEIRKLLDIISTAKTSYEKMGIDKRIYKLGKFYKENLESVNIEILECIKKFEEVGVSLSAEDFDYSIYVNEYMSTFFKEMKNINSKVLKSKFEEIYWKCPDLIIHIELNIRYLYLKNEKEIEKHFAYEKDKLKDEYVKIISPKIIEEISEKDLEEVNQNSIKFLNSLYEYKNYLRFQYIFEDIKKKYQEREQHKNSYNLTRKEIFAKEKRLEKLNKKINGKSLFGKKEKKDKKEQQTAEYNALILEIKESYKELEDNEVYTKIIDNLSDNSTIYDVLKFASQFYNYLTECIIENKKNITSDEIDIEIKELKEFLDSPNNIIIKNIAILEEKNISIIISDRYKLLNFTIEKEDITPDNLDNLIGTLEKIKNYYYIQKSGINLNEMEFICEFKKIENKK